MKQNGESTSTSNAENKVHPTPEENNLTRASIQVSSQSTSTVPDPHKIERDIAAVAAQAQANDIAQLRKVVQLIKATGEPYDECHRKVGEIIKVYLSLDCTSFVLVA